MDQTISRNMLITTAMLLAVQSANLTGTVSQMMAERSSGPCLGAFSCGPITSNLGYLHQLPDPAACRSECDRYPGCEYFTYFEAGNLAGVCFLFSACSQQSPLCRGACLSGPRCDSCESCTTSQGRGRSTSRTLNRLRLT